MRTILISNRVKCRKCEDGIESVRRHEFAQCKCGSIFTDGGLEYMRRGGEPADMEDMSESLTISEERLKKLRDFITDNDDNNLAMTVTGMAVLKILGISRCIG